MSTMDYCVIFENKNWHVRFQNLSYSYASRADAIRAAVETAHVCGKNGHQAQVRVQMPDQQFHTEWTYGLDAFPAQS